MQQEKEERKKIIVKLKMMGVVKKEEDNPQQDPKVNISPLMYARAMPSRPPLQAVENLRQQLPGLQAQQLSAFLLEQQQPVLLQAQQQSVLQPGQLPLMNIAPLNSWMPAPQQGNLVAIPNPRQGIQPHNIMMEPLTPKEWETLYRASEMKVDPYSKIMKDARHAHAFIFKSLEGAGWCCLRCQQAGKGQPNWRLWIIHKVGLEVALETPACPCCQDIVFHLKKIQTCLACELIFLKHQDTIKVGQVYEVPTWPGI